MRYWAAWLLLGTLLTLEPSPARAEDGPSRRIELGTFSFEAQGAWRVEQSSGAGDVTLTARPEGIEEGLLMLSAGPVPLSKGKTLARMAAVLYPDVEGAPATQWTPGRTSSGLAYVTSRILDKNAAGGATARYVFDVGGTVYDVSMRAANPVELMRLEALVRQGLMKAQRIEAAKAPAANTEAAVAQPSEPTPSAPPPAETPAAARETNASEGMRAQGFSLLYAQALGLVGQDKWGLSRDPSGKLWLAMSNARSAWGALPWHGALFTLNAEGKKEASAFTLGTLAPVLREGDLREFDTFEPDGAGHFFVGVQVGSYSRGNVHTVFALARPETGRWVPVVSSGFLQGLVTQGRGSQAMLRPTLNGEAWLFVRPGTGPLRIGYLQPNSEGGWNWTDVPTPADLAHEELFHLSQGAADGQGNYFVLNNGVLWRLGRDGGFAPHVKLDIPEPMRGGMSRPVILPNGDIWVALSQSGSVFQYTTPKTERTETLHSFATLSGHSSLVRIRVDKAGRPTLRFIDGADLHAALRKAGMPIRSSLLTMSGLWLDATGGLLTYDQQNEVVFSVRPLD